jgi:hypothetical protein
MVHSKSLRVIGQSLEAAKIPTFELEADGPNYVVKSELLTATREWVLRHALSRYDFSERTARQSTVIHSVRFNPADISRLDKQAQMQRRSSSCPPEGYRRMSQLMRTLGDQFDRMKASAFQISWVSDSVSVAFQLPDGEIDSRTYTAEKLQQLGSSSRILRSQQSRFDIHLSGSQTMIRSRNS